MSKTDEELKAEFLARKGATICPTHDRRLPRFSALNEVLAKYVKGAPRRGRVKGNTGHDQNNALYKRSWTEEMRSEKESYEEGRAYG